MLDINWCVEAHGKEGKGGGVIPPARFQSV
jgi:hypothetical protein